MTRRPLLLLVLALPAAALPACGGDEPAGRVRDGRVAVALDDFRYRPQLIRASAGRIRFDLVNRGRLAHTFRLERGEDQIVAKVSSLLPGDRARKTVRVRKGEYRFFCALSNHEELGMYGTLVVK
jgi:plastocyanin